MQDKKSGSIKTKIQSELLLFFEHVLAPYFGEEFGGIKKDIKVLKDDVAVLKDDVSILKDDVSSLKTEMMYVKNDIRDLKADIPSKKDYAVVKKLEKLHHSELSAFV